VNLSAELNHPIFKAVAEMAAETGVPVYVIGGYVRDLFLKRGSKDIDFVTVGDGILLAEKVASSFQGHHPVSVFRNFGTAMFHLDDLQLEFVGARRESYHPDSRKPDVSSGTLEDDQKRRDFTKCPGNKPEPGFLRRTARPV